ncbi:catechol oxidase [Ranunculus cassubicifolius]
MSLPLTIHTSTTTLGFNRRAKSPSSASKRPAYTSCQSQNDSGDKDHLVDRRNILISLTGVCGASTTLGNVAVGAPIKPVELGKCHLALDNQIPSTSDQKVECCPPDFSNMPIKDFKLPKSYEALRTRRPAHKLDAEYLAKYKEAVAKMKALPKDDPWNFYQQAQIHCQYCNGAYDQVGFPTVPLQVHFGWLFLPWHRFYLHFWEKILGKLIGDPTFAVPYWNWDTPEGMKIPAIYLDESSPLYDKYRNKDHYSALFDFKYKYGDPNPPTSESKTIITNNLRQIDNFFSEGKRDPSLFMGHPVLAGELPENDMGSLESLHNTSHMWVGPTEKPQWDMGNFHTAARDTLFWGHHGNVDRMWHIFSTFRGNKPEFKDKDWLDSSFIFYDENRELVKCRVKDCLHTAKLGYTYQQEPLPWLTVRRSYIKQRKAKKRSAGGDDSVTQVAEFGSETRDLDTTIRALVKRPKSDLSKDDKEDVTEVLIVDDITIVNEDEHVRFDVYIAKATEGLVSADLGEFAGSFVYIPHNQGNKTEKTKTLLRLGITNLVEDIEADSADSLVVTLVPGIGKVTIGGVKIDLVPVPVPEEEF